MTTNNSSRPSLRWWPAVVILVLLAGAQVFVWRFMEAPDNQTRVTVSILASVLTAFLLLLWLMLLSRLPWGTRFKIFGAAVVVLILGVGLFEIEGVSGNLMPILKFRFAGEGDYGGFLAKGDAGVTNPGPDDYPQLYGPRRDGKLPDIALARDWQASPPKELWRHDVGEAWSSFAVVGDAAVTMELRGSEEIVVRYDLETGAQVWTTGYEALFETTIGGNGPRATPTIADGRVYTFGATGVLTCLDLADGEILWQHDVAEATGSGISDWGESSSPLIVGETVVVQAGAAGKSLSAYDRESGELLWTSGEDRGSYGSPILAEVASREQILILNQTSVSGHDPATGETLWSAEWPGEAPKVATPVVLEGDKVLVSAGYGLGSRLYRLVPDGAGGLDAEEIWATPRLKSKFANIVLHEGTIYGLDDGVLVAIDPANGERLWKRGRYGHGQIILVGDLLLIQTEKGAVVLVEATPEEHRELARLEALDDKTWNPPALSGNLLLVRNHREAACYELPLADD